MFDIGKVYWFRLETQKGNTINIQGKVIEENEYMVKIERTLNKK